ncbi:MAG: hypothetical protein NTY50_16120 [Methylobacter sp.]|nr:hypothetical protein [Methylobacter sp.]
MSTFINIDANFVAGFFSGSLIMLLCFVYIPKVTRGLVEKNDEHIFGIIISLVGAVLLMAGLIFDNKYVYGVLAGVSGAFIGAGISTVAAKISVKSLEDNIRIILRESKKESFYNEETVDDFRREWYVYHVTNISTNRDRNKNEYVWRYTIWDFKNTKIPGKLFCHAEIPSSLGEETHKYKVEGVIKNQGGGLVVCTTRTDKAHHSAGIYIFPLFADKDIPFHFGFCIIKSSWSGKNMVSPCIISNRNILSNTDEIGFVRDPSDINLLDNKFEEMNDYTILPRIIDK